MDCSPPGSSVHGILQARILEWVAVPSSRGPYWLDWTWVCWVSCIGRRVLYHWAIWEAWLKAGCWGGGGGAGFPLRLSCALRIVWVLWLQGPHHSLTGHIYWESVKLCLCPPKRWFAPRQGCLQGHTSGRFVLWRKIMNGIVWETVDSWDTDQQIPSNFLVEVLLTSIFFLSFENQQGSRPWRWFNKTQLRGKRSCDCFGRKSHMH